MNEYIQIFALVTGIIYMVMQITQYKLMWYVDLLTAGAACYVSVANFQDGVWAPVWAQAAMNAYYIVMAVVGIVKWKQFDEKSGGRLHIVKPEKSDAAVAAAILAVGSPLLCFLLSRTNDPAPIADGLSMMFSIVGTWFLAKSFLENWAMWIAADILAVIIYGSQDAWWMAVLYFCYIISSVIGISHWKKNGIHISDQ